MSPKPPADGTPENALPRQPGAGGSGDRRPDDVISECPDIIERTAVPRGVTRGHAVVVLRLLSSRLAEPWTLDSLAEAVHLSRSQVVRVLEATVGLSPMACLRQLRVQHMARLLASTDLPVAAVARAVGWDAKYASRAFRAVYGMSPTEFRRQRPPLLRDG
ncbi:helix-turn-helix transcriptional regulator [Calidifontibacter sp. DB0510]|uniref:Helix-turn-helix transcriptional regulator n=1 Tax=Metallococcus carri TaxID=1656884 RepID=A0A967B1T1_9MICO|nr:helix-turn-helix transcriptional regulator [Metallococcus carri]NOP38492.1 helix-turn-helix transcriptional regulator [Calidifontibacter sp. DB2511S]